MTINDYEFLIAEDLYQENDVLLVNRGIGSCALSGVAITTVHKNITAAQLEAYTAIEKVLKKHLTNYQPWLLVGHSAWQPKTRVVHYKKIWAYLRDAGLDLPAGKALEEVAIESDKGVKYFSAIQCSNYEPESLLKVLRRELACSLLFVDSSNAENLMQQVINKGWEKQGSYPASALVETACKSSLLIGFHIGEFDDAEAGFAVIGRSELMAGVLTG